MAPQRIAVVTSPPLPIWTLTLKSRKSKNDALLNSIPNQFFSMKSKGGKRAGAGRKPSTIKGITRKLPKETAGLILAEINANSKWISLAQSKDERIQLDTLKYLTDRAHGKAAQTVEHLGSVTVVCDL